MNGATPKSENLVGRAAETVSRGDRAVPGAAISDAAASADGGTGGVQTPFYEQLMSMIHATALENRRAAQNDEADAAPGFADHGWRIHPLIPCIAGLVVVAAIGRVFIVSEVSPSQMPIVTADASNAFEERSRVVGKITTPEEPAEKPVPAPEPGGLPSISVEGKVGVEEKLTAEKEIAAGTKAIPADPIAPATDPTGEQPPLGIASEPPPAEALSSWPSAIETGSIERADDAPAATHTARVVSDVRMRAGPSNGQSVLATIARGSSVEVISCRAWCEVIFAGQRGWVYKDFIGALPTPRER